MADYNASPNGLHTLLRQRMAEAGVRSQAAMTVMAPHRDPYRMENYRPEAEWLAESMKQIDVRPVHVRGLHYASLGTVVPNSVVMPPKVRAAAGPPRANGTPYVNTEEAANWIADRPVKAGRWLKLVDWHDVFDKKNDDPIVERFHHPDPHPRILFGDVALSLPEDPTPKVDLGDFRPRPALQVGVIRREGGRGTGRAAAVRALRRRRLHHGRGDQ